ncbi:MAG: hypothetical protein QNJ15_10120 [Erythrobacter sp.]|nr:hypothetical protein [Erythrobacter sp.]
MLPDFSHLGIAIFYVVFFGGLPLAAWFGGAPERWGVAAFAGMLIVQGLPYGLLVDPTYNSVDLVVLISDVLAFAAFFAIALNARRVWPLFAASLQLISVLGHFARGVTDIIGFSYSLLNSVPTTLVMLLVLAGAVLHQMRLRRRGEDPDWVPFRQYSEFRELAT